MIRTSPKSHVSAKSTYPKMSCDFSPSNYAKGGLELCNLKEPLL